MRNTTKKMYCELFSTLELKDFGLNVIYETLIAKICKQSKESTENETEKFREEKQNKTELSVNEQLLTVYLFVFYSHNLPIAILYTSKAALAHSITHAHTQYFSYERPKYGLRNDL